MIRFTTLFLACALLASAGTFTGVITDSMCVADHKAMKMGTDPDCAKACAKSHGTKFVLFDGKKSYKLSDQQTPAQFAAKKVKVTGTLFEKTGIIQVEKIEVAK